MNRYCNFYIQRVPCLVFIFLRFRYPTQVWARRKHSTLMTLNIVPIVPQPHRHLNDIKSFTDTMQEMYQNYIENDPGWNLSKARNVLNK